MIYGAKVPCYFNNHARHRVGARLLYQNAIEHNDPATYGEFEREGRCF